MQFTIDDVKEIRDDLLAEYPGLDNDPNCQLWYALERKFEQMTGYNFSEFTKEHC